MDTKVIRKDAVDKVKGRARYAGDLEVKGMLVGKILHSPHANAFVKAVRTEKALALEGVEAVLTSKDAPEKPYTPCGHPYTFVPKELENMRIITDHPRYVGDAVAAVVAVDEVTAQKALDLIEVDYEVLPFVLDVEEAVQSDAPLIHEERPGNILASFCEFSEGTSIEKAEDEADAIIETTYETTPVSHCHIEVCNSYAYVDGNGRVTVVTSTQIPFLARLRVSQALNIPQGQVRIIKPVVGGGFGNKQDVNQEPMNALMSLAVDGRPVRLSLTREECFYATRTRYGIKMKCRASANKKGELLGFDMTYYANGGAYATHNHSIAITAAHFSRLHYQWKALHTLPITVFTNRPSGGAMRGYGAPQGVFGIESAVDDLAYELGLDPVELRLNNLRPVGYVEEEANIHFTSNGMEKCLRKGRELIRWGEKRELYRNQTGLIRRGVGCAAVAFCCGTVPFNVEMSGARISLLDDGYFTLQVGATEIGQGSDTTFAQIAAEVLSVPVEKVAVVSTQDSDVSPYDGGAFATRQTYICGTAVVKAATELKQKILTFAKELYNTDKVLDLIDEEIIDESGLVIGTLKDLALHSIYDKVLGEALTSDVSVKMQASAPSFVACFADVTVNIEDCHVKVNEIWSIHDSGRIINRMQAEGQAQGGTSMGIGYGLYEQLLFGANCQVLNDNFLDYKLPTIMDIPRINVDFVETYEPTGPLGAKGIGEPPACGPAAAIRNAILNATGVHINTLPMTPQKLYEAFEKEGFYAR